MEGRGVKERHRLLPGEGYRRSEGQYLYLFPYMRMSIFNLCLCLSPLAYARAVWSDMILHDFIRRLGIAQEELAHTKSRLAQVDRSSHSGAELETLWDQL